MFGQNLTLGKSNQRVRVMGTFLPQRTRKFVQISEKFGSLSFELLDRFYQGPIANAHGTKRFV